MRETTTTCAVPALPVPINPPKRFKDKDDDEKEESMKLSAALARYLSGREHARHCCKCDKGLHSYPGRYPAKCPHCGEAFVTESFADMLEHNVTERHKKGKKLPKNHPHRKMLDKHRAPPFQKKESLSFTDVLLNEAINMDTHRATRELQKMMMNAERNVYGVPVRKQKDRVSGDTVFIIDGHSPLPLEDAAEEFKKQYYLIGMGKEESISTSFKSMLSEGEHSLGFNRSFDESLIKAVAERWWRPDGSAKTRATSQTMISGVMKDHNLGLREAATLYAEAYKLYHPDGMSESYWKMIDQMESQKWHINADGYPSYYTNEATVAGDDESGVSASMTINDPESGEYIQGGDHSACSSCIGEDDAKSVDDSFVSVLSNHGDPLLVLPQASEKATPDVQESLIETVLSPKGGTKIGGMHFPEGVVIPDEVVETELSEIKRVLRYSLSEEIRDTIQSALNELPGTDGLVFLNPDSGDVKVVADNVKAAKELVLALKRLSGVNSIETVDKPDYDFPVSDGWIRMRPQEKPVEIENPDDEDENVKEDAFSVLYNTFDSYMNESIFANVLLEKCVPNEKGDRWHDDETGIRCAPKKKDGSNKQRSKKKKKGKSKSKAKSDNVTPDHKPEHNTPEAKTKAISTYTKKLTALSEKGMAVAKNAFGSVKGRSWDKLHPTVQKAMAGVAMAVAKPLVATYHGVESPRHLIEKMAVKAAEERGLDAKSVKRVQNMIFASRVIEQWVTNIPAAHYILHDYGVDGFAGFLGAKAGALIPVASTAYMIYSGVRNPKATARAAWSVLKDAFTGKKHEEQSDIEDLINGIMDGEKKHGEWYSAVFSAALDQTGDMDEAKSMTDHAMKEHPEEPKSESLSESVKDEIQKIVNAVQKCPDYGPTVYWNEKEKYAFATAGDGYGHINIIQSLLNDVDGIDKVEADAETHPSGYDKDNPDWVLIQHEEDHYNESLGITGYLLYRQGRRRKRRR